MKIGFIGLGSMGNPMAMNILKGGHQLTVHDVRREASTNLVEAGAKWENTPKDAAKGAEVVFTSLPGPKEAEAVALGPDSILEGITKGSVYIDLTTNFPTLVRKIHKIYGEKGVEVLDAPVSQGTARAKWEGTLTIMVGGNRAVFERVKPVLGLIGRDRLIYCGESGAGAICKLCNNLMLFMIVNGLAEVLTLGVKAGVKLETLTDVISKSSGGNRIVEGFANSPTAKGQFERKAGEGFSLALAWKDVHLANELGREFNVPLTLGNVVEQDFIAALNRGWGSLLSNTVLRLQEDRSGVQLRA